VIAQFQKNREKLFVVSDHGNTSFIFGIRVTSRFCKS
jgi:hypothetical protein